MAGRIEVSLQCEHCGKRNYRTTRRPEMQGQLKFNKFCPVCKQHTVHLETK